MTGQSRILATAVLAGALLGTGAAQAQQKEGELMRDTLSTLGLIERDRPAINYRERAPLVMPPKLDGKALPPPRSANASPEWPREPEIVARQKAEQEARVPKGNQPQGRYNDNNVTLSIDEMRSGRREGANLTTEVERKPGDNHRDSFWVNPLELLKGVGETKTEPVLAEPSREMLTEPPTGYRKAPKPVARNTSDPINNPSRERDEADPGRYIRSR
ncbi:MULTISPECIES: hypothetical protein [Methylobacterium]|uniref:DUF3035 domain-containing protein n=3 Tax=Pseudomonadota TaxID=1224 RepID=A0ABQ4SS95_9HYPH|nr:MULTISPECIES: hypothetical protein [Methylobacterium]PIU06189.1 MAG: hypothetical protein COT56_10145 [Methylobacterium sp. CG09_land_8_20_14_0_10_71_15]PIU14480.1 MAG: hypothetical protein COT28_07410 [Methylobacterium sp. CG08_land_8_20_14_0_20_71_15]GBU18240.1 hypothetical protein AwMethylo_24550 [Methylobacterium sp.]GJE05161.1 hypothetical protein AOPFMNJM_0458 [Methylobacterium jeotgali]